MTYATHLATEALVVGGMLAAALVLAARLYPVGTDAGKTAALGFVVGALVHLVFEASKANQWYCEHGAACAALTTRGNSSP